MTLSEYFEKNRYKGKYEIGDRVIGKWNKIPFVGTVLSDSLISNEEGPRLMVYSDLPIKHNDTYHYVIKLKPSDVKYFK